ncbi:MAG: PilZ domain-containing protein [Novosphingobium sp.]
MRPFSRRAHARERVRHDAQLITPGGAIPALLHDLSVKGACLSLAGEAEPGNEVVVRWGCFAAVGRVARVDGRTCGLEFDHELDARVVAVTRQGSKMR